MAIQDDKRTSKVVLSLGSNLGDREQALVKAKNLINKKIGSIFLNSNTFETEGWGETKLNTFLNEIVIVHTVLDELEVLFHCLSIEKEIGRKRNNQDKKTNQYENRIIDIDLIYYNSLITKTSDLTIPHPKLHLRKFILEPLNEIASDWLHPLFNKSTRQLLSECSDNTEVKRYS